MKLDGMSHKEIGRFGERAAAEYLRRHKFRILDRNVAHKTGELDIVVQKDGVLCIIEVKSVTCDDFPSVAGDANVFDPAENLHAIKMRKVVRTGEWYVAEKGWEGEWQVDGVVVWLRKRDGIARVRYLPQIV